MGGGELSASPRAGFTLIEVLVAMALLGFAVLGAQAVVTDRLARNVGNVDQRSVARQLVEDRLQQVQTEPRYNDLIALFNRTEPSPPGAPGFMRRTTVDRRSDYTVVTVRVFTPQRTDTVSGTAVVGMP
jgi:prepilin-type N-terminal cleavage/methylation domain-containing protein